MASEEAQQELSSLMHTYICHDCGMHFLSESYFKQHVMRVSVLDTFPPIH